MEIKIINKELYNNDNLPTYATSGSVGLDLLCPHDMVIHPNQVRRVNTGLAIHIGSYEISSGIPRSDILKYSSLCGMIVPRSSLGSKGLVIANTIGVIDEDYQGEIIVNLWNRNNNEVLEVFEGERFAQLMVVPVVKPYFTMVDEFTHQTSRGSGGFGSTGR